MVWFPSNLAFCCILAAMAVSALVHRVSATTCLLFSLVALYFLNRISHSVYDSSPPPKVAMSTRGALGKSPSGKGKVKHGWTNDHIRIHCNWLMLHSHFSFIDSSCSTFSLVSFPNHFSPHNVEKDGLGMILHSVIYFEVDYYLEVHTLTLCTL